MAEHFDQDYIRLLAHKWRRGTLTDAERVDLARWEASHADELLELPVNSGGPEAVKARMYRRMALAMRRGQRRKLVHWLPYAAAVLVAALVGYFAVVSRQSLVESPVIADIAPGGNRATLTLADGRTIALSQQQAGIIVGDGITYLDGSTVFGEQVSTGTSERVDGPVRNHKLTGSHAHHPQRRPIPNHPPRRLQGMA